MNTKKRNGILFLTIALVFCSTISSVFATTQDEIVAVQQEQADTMAALVSVQERIEEIESKKGETEAYLQELNKQISELNAELEDLQAQFTEKQHELDLTNQELADARLDEETQRENMAIRIQYMYENSTDAGILESVFSAKSFSDFLTRAENMTELTNFDRQMLENYITICSVIEEKQMQVEEEQAEIEELRLQCEAKREELGLIYEATDQEVKKMAEEIEDDESLAAELVATIQQQEAILNTLAAQAAAEIAAAEAASAAAYAQSAGGESAVSGETAPAATTADTTVSPASSYVNTSTWDGPVLTRSGGVNQGPTGKETYYNLNMSGVVDIMRNMGNSDSYWVRDDGVKMLGDYVMVAANLESHPRGSLVESSLGTAIVCDTGTFAASNPEQLDIAVAW